MAVNAFDSSYMTGSDLKKIEQFTADWEKANKAGNEASKNAAAAAAAKLRASYGYNAGEWGDKPTIVDPKKFNSSISKQVDNAVKLAVGGSVLPSPVQVYDEAVIPVPMTDNVARMGKIFLVVLGLGVGAKIFLR